MENNIKEGIKNLKFREVTPRMFLIFLKLILFSLFSVNSSYASTSKTLITINQFVSHPALDQAKFGIEEALKDRGLYPDSITIKFDNAQGNIATSAQISKHQASLQPAFMIAIATPASQNNLKAAEKTSIIAFAAVSSPEDAGLAEASNIIGVTDSPPLEELIEIVLQILPQTKTIGVVYNGGEINSVKLVEKLAKLAKDKNLTVEKVQITTSTNIKAGAQKLVGKVDFIYIPLDNTVVSALSSLVQVATLANIPVVANDPSLVDSGLLLALGSDYFKSGMQLGNMIADKIERKELQQNIQVSSARELKINKAVAEKLKITIPSELENSR
jgi:putative ABC transport system substrate-binding protein